MRTIFVFFASLRAFGQLDPPPPPKTKLDKLPEQIISRIADGLNIELPCFWYNIKGGSAAQKNSVFYDEANDIFEEIKSGYFPGLIHESVYDALFALIRGKAYNSLIRTEEKSSQIAAAKSTLQKFFEETLITNLVHWADFLGVAFNEKLKDGAKDNQQLWEDKRDYLRSKIQTTPKLVHLTFGDETGVLVSNRRLIGPKVVASQILTNRLPNEQSLKMSASFAETETRSITTSASFSFEISQSFTIKVGKGIEGISKIEFAYTLMEKFATSNTRSISEMLTNTRTKTYEFPLTAPPNMSVQGEVSVTEEEIDFDFIQQFDINGVQYSVKGTWRGVKRDSQTFKVSKTSDSSSSTSDERFMSMRGLSLSPMHLWNYDY